MPWTSISLELANAHDKLDEFIPIAPIFKPLFLQISLPNFKIGQKKSCSPDICLNLCFQTPPQIQPLTWLKFPMNMAGSGRFSELQTGPFKT